MVDADFLEYLANTFAALPVGAINTAGRQVVHIVKRLREELQVNTTCGASNISFGLPNRHGLNAAFLSMAIGVGLTSAITNPLHPEMMQAALGSNVLMGNDPNCRRWVQQYREPQVANGGALEGRRAGRRRRVRSGDRTRSNGRVPVWRGPL